MGRPRGADERAVIEAAARLFRANGYTNTSIGDIARAVGVSRPTVYQYIASKNAVVERVYELILERIERLVPETEVQDPGERLRVWIHRYVLFVIDFREYWSIYFSDEKALPHKTRQKYRDRERRLMDKFSSLFAECAKRGIVRSDVEPEIAARLVAGMVSSIWRWYQPQDPLTSEDIAKRTIAMLEGYMATKAPAMATKAPVSKSRARSTRARSASSGAQARSY